MVMIVMSAMVEAMKMVMTDNLHGSELVMAGREREPTQGNDGH